LYRATARSHSSPLSLHDALPIYSMSIVQEEIFGPVLSAMPFDDEDDLADIIHRANDTEYGLAAGIWTTDVRKAHKVAHSLEAGTVWVNDYNALDAAVPFGGY